MWVKANPDDTETVGTPFGLAYYARGSPFEGSQRRKTPSGMHTNPIPLRNYSKIRVVMPDRVDVDTEFSVMLHAPSEMSAIVDDDAEVKLFVRSGTVHRVPPFDVRIARGDWRKTEQGFQLSTTVPGLPAGHYWMDGLIYYGRDNFNRNKSELHNLLRWRYFEVGSEEEASGAVE